MEALKYNINTATFLGAMIHSDATSTKIRKLYITNTILSGAPLFDINPNTLLMDTCLTNVRVDPLGDGSNYAVASSTMNFPVINFNAIGCVFPTLTIVGNSGTFSFNGTWIGDNLTLQGNFGKFRFVGGHVYGGPPNTSGASGDFAFF